jgi:hypothetical protein
MSKDVTTTEENLPTELMQEFEADAGAGLENADSDSFSIPFLRIIQSNSPEIEDLDGAKPGMIVNTATSELYDEITVVPVTYERTFIEWVPRDNGGGIVQFWSVEDGKAAEAQHGRDGAKIRLPNGDDLIDTRQHYVLLKHEDGSTEPALIAMSSTQINNSKEWMNKINRVKVPNSNKTAPMFAGSYTLSTRKRQKDSYSWYVWTIEYNGFVDADTYHDAKTFLDSIKSGEAKADMSQAEEHTEEEY